MEEITSAFEELKKTCSKKRGKGKKQLALAINQTEPLIGLLSTSSLSLPESEKLVQQLRRPLQLAYTSFPQVALQFCARLADYLYNNKILAEYTAGRHDQRAQWESVLYALLSGVLDYYEDNEGHYLALEALLNLFAQILPTAQNTAASRARTAFIQSVFVISVVDPAKEKVGREIAKLLENLRNGTWESVVANILQMLALADISYPQPFEVKEMIICGVRKPLDTLYADNTELCGNVVIEDDQYESLVIPYASVQKIEISRLLSSDGESDRVQINANLTEMPVIGRECAVLDSVRPKDQGICVQFELESSSLPRFLEAAQNRKLDKRLIVQKLQKSSLSLAAANLEVDSNGKFVGKSERYENLLKLYGTNDPSDEAPDQGRISDRDEAMVQTMLTPPTSVLNPIQLLDKKRAPTKRTEATAIDTSKVAFHTPQRLTVSQTAADKCNEIRDENVSPVESKVKEVTKDHVNAKGPTTRNRRKNQVISDDEIEDVITSSTLAVSRRRSTLNLAPTQRPHPSSATLAKKASARTAQAASAGRPKALAPDPSSPDLTERCKPATATEDTVLTIAAKINTSPALEEPDTVKAGMSSVTRSNKPPTKAHDSDEEHPAAPSSKLVKKSLRNKAGTCVEKPAAKNSKKRKAGVPAEDQNAKPAANDDTELQPPPVKRQRLQEALDDSSMTAVQSTGRMKRYRAKRDRNALVHQAKKVDYDEIPEDSSKSGQRSSSPLAGKGASKGATHKDEKQSETKKAPEPKRAQKAKAKKPDTKPDPIDTNMEVELIVGEITVEEPQRLSEVRSSPPADASDPAEAELEDITFVDHDIDVTVPDNVTTLPKQEMAKVVNMIDLTVDSPPPAKRDAILPVYRPMEVPSVRPKNVQANAPRGSHWQADSNRTPTLGFGRGHSSRRVDQWTESGAINPVQAGDNIATPHTAVRRNGDQRMDAIVDVLNQLNEVCILE
ncbi:hypothetical protein EUX98_g1222 [Antrodiella citrinella]|uniref:Uncharacterized protein n=1 Tax=Antrodiella citrinella TaxID=2447956 RepID=A0A4S4N535_9APHY|nr:hypothetical protein EUX98_g1222 [Antrodiella citrinella]